MTTHFKISLIFTIVFSASLFIGCSQAGNGGTQSSSEQTADNTADLPKVKISTEFGDILIELYNETPAHRDNFLKLAREGFFDETLFHRVIDGFMIQGGDPSSKNAQQGQQVGSGGPGYTLPAEITDGLFHKKGAVAAARQGDQMNPERRSSGSQFYIVHGRVFRNEELDALEQQTGRTIPAEQREIYTTVGGTPHLDEAYTVFGQVISGLDVVDQIAGVETGAADRPVSNVPMTVTVIE
ncbi:MAG: peptidylprolyl isomerase [Bacteroidales bacterium]